MSTSGYIYILSNPHMPGLLKIGKTARGGRERADEIFKGSSGVPSPFVLEFEIFVKDIDADEITVHDVLSEYRLSNSREFFKCDLDCAIEAVVATALDWVADLLGAVGALGGAT